MKRFLRLAAMITALMLTCCFVSCNNSDDDDDSNDNGTSVQSQNSYIITFDANGGSFTKTATQNVKNTATSVILSSADSLGLSRSGFAFLGWATNSAASTPLYGDKETIPISGNITLYALWVSTSENAVTKSSDGFYHVTPYNIAATVEAIAASGVTAATLVVTNGISHTTGGTQGGAAAKLAQALNTGSSTAVTLDLSKTWLTNSDIRYFSRCKGLVGIVIPTTVTEIEANSFFYCTNLRSIEIPNSVATIGRKAFSGCTSLSSIVIPASVTTIGNDAFENCENLVNVTYAGTIEQWCSMTFYSYSYAYENTWCQILRYATNITIGGKSIAGELVIPNTVETIASYAFVFCSVITGVTIQDGVTSIGRYAFSRCENITSVVIPDSVTTIGQGAFVCNAFTSITLPKNIAAIEGYTFKDCRKLIAINIPEGVTTIGERAFYGCTALASVSLPDSLTTIGEEAFFTYTSGEIFGGIDNLRSIIIPKNVTYIGMQAFRSYNSNESTPGIKNPLDGHPSGLHDATFVDTESIWYYTVNGTKTEIGAMSATDTVANATAVTNKGMFSALYNSNYSAE